MMVLIIVLPVYFMAALAVAEYADRRRWLGFRWGFLFGLTLSPVVSSIIALLCKSGNQKKLMPFSRLLLLVTSFSCLALAGLLINIAAGTFSETGIFFIPAGSWLYCIEYLWPPLYFYGGCCRRYR